MKEQISTLFLNQGFFIFMIGQIYIFLGQILKKLQAPIFQVIVFFR